MTENEYQADVKQLWEEMNQRANTAVDYLVTQPPLKLARQELYALLEWAMHVGAEQPDIVKERMRRRRLAAKSARQPVQPEG